MASVSVSPALQPPSPFESRSPPSSPSRAHRRQASRNPNASPLPDFTFNASAMDDTMARQIGGETTDENSMDLNTRKTAKAAPLPNFTFNPGASLPPEPERSPSPIHPVLQEMALNQQRVSRSARPAPLPAFAFAPHTSSGQPSPSPTRSTFPDMPNSAGSGMGHRRGNSEFVGGAIGGPQLVSTSPEKPEYRPPPLSGPPRGGHTHRRSQAVSISDIETSDLIKTAALSKARAGSTPTTPSEVAQQFSFPKPSPPSQSSTPGGSRSPPSSPRRRDSMPGARPRVGFADRVEMIPRPLSLISSETEGSCSTVRGHSVSGSINSIATSPTPRTVSNVSSPVNVEIEVPPARPRTADPTTLLFSGSERAEKAMSMVTLPKRPLSASGSPAVTLSGSPPTKKKHFWSSNSPNMSPTPTPKVEGSDPLAALTPLVLSPAPQPPRPKTSPERTGSVKKRKYHTWTSGIFSKKTGKRSAKPKSKRTPTPPALTRRASDKINEIFDADDTIVIREPSPVVQRSRPRPKSAVPSVPSYPSPEVTNDVTSPVLDLDAALSPFGDDAPNQGTPTRTQAARIAKLHSAERRGNVDAFGSFHKRSESAPSMQPVNRASFNIQRLGSNPSLNEVFDEEEEDNFLAYQTANSSDAGSSRKPSNPTDVSMLNVEERRDSSLSPRTRPIDGLGLSVRGNSSDGVVIVDPEDDVTQTEHRSSKSTIEAPIFDDFSKRPASSPMAFAYPAPQSHYASSTEGRTTCTSASMISSPDPDHVSFDNFPRTNRFLTEPSPDFVLRNSNEDLPSLSDSISSGAVPRISSSANTRSSVEHRAQSVCVPATPRSSNPTWKRASLASLNRLIPGSANGSKLKFETVPDVGSTDEKAKKKTNRISRLMHFWRSKEKESN